jgi:serralysin
MRGAGGGTAGIGGGLGDYNLSQQMFTIMSYNDGWATSPYGQPSSGGLTGTSADNYGWMASLAALDIAVIQDKYGVNEEWATGDDTYTINDFNGAGNYYSTIWDAGGSDLIAYDGSADANIDLRPATLQYEEGGGGWVSYAWGLYGGFTIANGVTIENARSGSGNDTLTGNDAANRLESGAGNDAVSGGAGDDILIGGAGQDTLSGGAGADIFLYQANADSLTGVARDSIADFTHGSDHIDLSALNAAKFIGTALFSGQAGQVRYASFDGSTIIELDSNGDRVADFQVELKGGPAVTFSDFIGLEIDATAKGGGGGKKTVLLSSSSTSSNDTHSTDMTHSWDLHQHMAQDYLVI